MDLDDNVAIVTEETVTENHLDNIPRKQKFW